MEFLAGQSASVVPRDEHEMFVVFDRRDVHTPKYLRFEHHNAGAELVNKPVRSGIASKFLHYELNLTRLAMVDHPVTFSYVYARLVFQWH